MRNPKDYTVIVMSCDAYSDIWPYFAKCWDRFWPSCPFDTYLISEEKKFHHTSIQNITTGKPMQWGEMLLHVIKEVDTPYLIYLQEDYLLRAPVDETNLNHYLGLFESLNAAYMRLLPWPGPDQPHPNYPEIGLLLPDSKYRTSLQAAVWDKEILKSLVMTNDDGRFESWSIERAKQIDRPFLCLNRNGISEDINHDGDYPLNYFATSVFQGKWLKEALKLYSSLGIKINSKPRGVMNRVDFWEYHERKKGTKHLKYKVINGLKRLLQFINRL
jgi:hypothetical protein